MSNPHCKAELKIDGDDGGYATMVCCERPGHDGPHREAYPRSPRARRDRTAITSAQAPGSTDWPTCEVLVERGLMRKYRPNDLTGGDVLFVVTKDGCALLGVKEPQ